MKQTPERARHDHFEAGTVAQSVGPPGDEEEEGGQQLIGWRLFVCLAIGAGLWLGVIQLVASGVSGSGILGRILSVIRSAVIFAGLISLGLAAMAGLNEVLRRSGPHARRGSAKASPWGAGGPLP